jgi:hypothetical protein
MANYAIIDEKGGWLVNSVVWNGNLEDWQPPTGTIAVPFEEVDFQSLPEKPEECF